MKKIDKLVLDAFLGPFLITFLVVVFILLNIQMLKYFDDIIGKGLDWTLVAQLFFYFGVFTTPTALPLAVLLSALIAYGNLGEHFELTAIKAAGISLIRTLRPIFFFVLLLTGLAFYANNNLVPKAALEAYSLLYDIKQKKPALDLREGIFYGGIPDISIKVNERLADEETLKDIIIYDHRKNDGNKEVTVADSGRMYTILNERYLKLELFNGYNYTEGMSSESDMVGQKKRQQRETLNRSRFDKTQVVFDLSSFQLERTEKKWFQNNRIMRNLSELDRDLDSINRERLNQSVLYYTNRITQFRYFKKRDSLIMPMEVYKHKLYRDSVAKTKLMAEYASKQGGAVTDSASGKTVTSSVEQPKSEKITSSLRQKISQGKAVASTGSNDGVKKEKVNDQKQDSTAQTFDMEAHNARIASKLDSIFHLPAKEDVIQSTANMMRQVKSQISTSTTEIDRYRKDIIIFEIQWHKIIASSFACIAMFLIGAPLGAIIKKGGLGVPFLVSVLFFIVYYVLTIQGEKFAKQEAISVITGVWMPDFILLLIGLFFLRQARVDARLFDTDFYMVALDKLKASIRKRKQLQVNPG